MRNSNQIAKIIHKANDSNVIIELINIQSITPNLGGEIIVYFLEYKLSKSGRKFQSTNVATINSNGELKQLL